MDLVGVGLALGLLALMLRLLVHLGATPSGVDTWYYLASADALRRSWRLPIRLPQYLLQDRTESYAPGFVVFLALLPRRLVGTAFWLISPLVDALHVLLLYAFLYLLTNSVVTAAVGGLIYALVPQLIAETRSLNPRALGVLLLSLSMYLVLRFTVPPEEAEALRLGAEPWVVAIAAVIAIAGLVLTQSPTGAVSLVVATTALTAAYGDVRYIAFAGVGFVAAYILTGGFYARVIANHLNAVRFWRRNLRSRGAEPIMDSPIYGDRGGAVPEGVRERRPTRWQSTRWQLVRLVGENPFVIPMILTPPPAAEWWGGRMYWWAIAVYAWALATTVVPPLRIFGPGYMYLKAAVFPTAVTLALGVGPRTLGFPYGSLVLAAGAMSVAAIVFFLVYTRSRQSERTSSVPPQLERVTSRLRAAPLDGVLVLPFMYADYVCYNAGKRTLWGGHSGDLTRFEAIFPVVRSPFDQLIREYNLHYVLLDLSYVTPERIRLDGVLDEMQRDGQFALYEIR